MFDYFPPSAGVVGLGILELPELPELHRIFLRHTQNLKSLRLFVDPVGRALVL